MSAQKKISQCSVADLKKILQGLNTYYNVESVSDSEDLFAQGLLDSLILIQYVMALEKTFKIQIQNPHINYENFKTFISIKSVLDKNYLS